MTTNTPARETPTIPADAVAAGAASLNAAHWAERNRLETVNAALVAALEELLDASYSQKPTYEEGKKAQDAWADRRAAARNNAAALVKAAKGE